MGRGSGAGGAVAGRARAAGAAQGVPTYGELRAGRIVERTVAPQDLAGATSFGRPVAEDFARLVDAESHFTAVSNLQRDVFSKGQAVVDRVNARQPIVVVVNKSGMLDVVNGRHRIVASQAFPNIRLRVRFEKGFKNL